MAPVRAMFATAVDDGLVRANPCAGLRLPGGGSVDRTARALTEDELQRLVAEVPERWRLVVRFLSQTGLRIGELVLLRWSDVDLKAWRVRVQRRLYRRNLDTPKCRYGVRDVPLSTALVRDLKAHRRPRHSRRTATWCLKP